MSDTTTPEPEVNVKTLRKQLKDAEAKLKKLKTEETTALKKITASLAKEVTQVTKVDYAKGFKNALDDFMKQTNKKQTKKKTTPKRKISKTVTSADAFSNVPPELETVE